VYPTDTEYYIIVGDHSAWGDYEHSPTKEIRTGVCHSVINDTHAYINVTYSDELDKTNLVDVYVTQRDPNDPRTPINIDSDTGTASNETFVFIVADYTGEDYHIQLIIDHEEFGDVVRDHSVHFPGMLVDLNLPPFAFLVVSFLMIVFVAGMFSATTAETGAMVCCAMAWVFLAFGWLSSLGAFAPISVTLASVYAVAINISARHRKGGYI